MMTTRSQLIAASLLLTMDSGCHSREKAKNRYDSIDGGYILREECSVSSMNCYDACFKREASVTCGGCCRDQRFLCDTQQKYSFESCDGTQ
jgi:hypothetical protein